MGALDIEVIKEGGGVVGHVLEAVDALARQADEGAQQLRDQRAVLAPAVQLAGQADVAVVEPDHPVAEVDDFLAELVVPQHELGAQAHDEQHRRRRDVTEVLVVDLDVAPVFPRVAVLLPRGNVGVAGTDLHQGSTSLRCSRLTSTMKLAK